MSGIEFHEGDVIVHDEGSETNESTWIRHKDGRWRSTSTAQWDDDVAARWIAINAGRLVHRAPRPTLPVELPTEPTLGWVHGNWSGGPRLAVWKQDGKTWLQSVDADGDTAPTHVPSVTAFTEAVAVPKPALDELRRFEHTDLYNPRDDLSKLAVIRFLAAVDEANGDRA